MKDAWPLPLALIVLVNVALAKPMITATGARILPEGVILAWGSTVVGGARAPVVLSIDASGRVRGAYYVLPGYGVTILDCVEEGGRLVATGFVVSGEGRKALVFELENGTVGWAYALSGGFIYAKSIVQHDGDYVLAGSALGDFDSEVAVARISRQGSIKGSWSFGSPMYNDFAERAYVRGPSILLVGSTWSHNVSLSDVFVASIANEHVEFLTIGGAAQDEGLAAVVAEGGLGVAGSTHSSIGGLSDAFYAALEGGAATILTVGWPSYDGFVDVYADGRELFILGYTLFGGESRGLLIRVEASGAKRGVLIESEGGVVPLAIGPCEGGLVIVVNANKSLVLVKFNRELEPLAALTLEGSAVDRIRVLNADLKGRVYNVETWRVQRFTLPIKRLEVHVSELRFETRALNLSTKPVAVEKGEYRERVPPLPSLIRSIEERIPLLMLFLPLLIVIVVVIIAKRKV